MWKYEQATGQLWRDDKPIAKGYSGYGHGKNNPLMESVHNIGVIPKGLYIIGAPYNSLHTGNYTLPLTPDIHNIMFGRNDFCIHGDSIQHPGTASNGCIILDRNTREEIWVSDDKELEVI